MADAVLPPVVEHVRPLLRQLEEALSREMPDAMIVVSWARSPWTRFVDEAKNKGLPKSPFADVARGSYVSVDGQQITDMDQARDTVHDRCVPGYRGRASHEKMTIGTYWKPRYYSGPPEPETKTKGGCTCIFCDSAMQGEKHEMRSIIHPEVCPEVRQAVMNLADAMAQYYQQDPAKNGFCASVYPPEDQPLLAAYHILHSVLVEPSADFPKG